MEAAVAGVTTTLIGTAFAFGFRHGFDWDHIAAITDITSSSAIRARSFMLATLYALGHALVVLVLGAIALAAGDLVPDSIDAAMGRAVGVTLIALGLYVVYSLVRHGRSFRMRSRWMLVADAARALVKRGRSRATVVIEHAHEHDVDGHGHAHDDVGSETERGRGTVLTRARTRTHSHVHTHAAPLPDDPFAGYGNRAAATIGVVHGVGAETPTQVLLFVTAAGASGVGHGLLLLASFVCGLLASNTLVAGASILGYTNATKNFGVYATVAVVTAAFSVGLGVVLLLGG